MTAMTKTSFLSSLGPAVQEAEKELLSEVDTREGWALIEYFSGLVRESGTEDEFKAARYIVERLKDLGVPVRVYEPELYISLPRAAVLQIEGEKSWKPRAKTPSFSVSTGDSSITGEIFYLPSTETRDFTELFNSHLSSLVSIAGKVVLTEGFPMPTTVRAVESQGAVAAIFVHPGGNIHEMICTTIWGNPTCDNISNKPAIPVVSVNRTDGERLIQMSRSQVVRATVKTSLDERWRPCVLPVAHIEAREQPHQFLLIHGHYDSWHVGVGDNATGDAVLLELARIFHSKAELLKRSLKIAWWPGHSTGRYAGSTWFADMFGPELRKNCIGQVNIDSPGCRGATSFREVMWMAECSELCQTAIADQTGKESNRVRPMRAGDYSFNQIGLSSYFMLLSNRPRREREKLGFYPVGGCGGDIAWHTEEDTLDVADRKILEQDLRIYVSAIARTLNADILPYDFRVTAEELREALEEYAEQAGDRFSLKSVFDELQSLTDQLDQLYREIEGGKYEGNESSINRLLMEIARRLVPINYAYGERFDQDPAEPLDVIPKLRDLSRLSAAVPGSDEEKFLLTGLVRQRNKVANQLYEVAEMIRLTRQAIL